MTSIQTLTSEVTAWANQDPESDYRDTSLELLERLKGGDESALATARELFGSRLAFGTAGIRGPMRGGPNGMNRLVISQTTAGVARYLLEKSPSDNPDHHVVIGFDGRYHSETFARDTAEVLSGHGIRVALLPRMLPTPVLAFSVRELEATAGVMITASHNPAEDNGYKVYFGGRDEGSQIIPPVDTEIEAHVLRVAQTETWSTIRRSTDLVSVIDDDIVEKYLSDTLNSLRLVTPTKPAPTVVYTSMHGVGGETFLSGMVKAGFHKPHVVDEQFEPDPGFPTVAFPNPEEKGALDLSFEKARSVGADLIIAHDPDADRLAVALPDPSTSVGYRALTGNQLGAIFGWHIARRAHTAGKVGTIANSVVSSPIFRKIADYFGLNHEETLTGFKYISRVKNLIFGFEEALGYLVNPDVVRDKDGISAAMLIISLAQSVADEGRTLWDYLGEIEESVGTFASGQITISVGSGVSGTNVMSSLREMNLERIGSRLVTRSDDFLRGGIGFPRADLLRYFLDDGSRVIVRPSGTEPKVKIYVDTIGETSSHAESRLKSIEIETGILMDLIQH